MRTFFFIWLGQLVSTIGTYMTEFALILWAWQVTGSVTALALVNFFSRLLRIPLTFIAGIVVDRFSRKKLMILADMIALLCTIAIGILYFTHQLQIWHLYITAAITGGAGQVQTLAYQTSLTLIVPSQHFIRANSMNSAVHYSSAILSPALAGFLFPHIGLPGVLLIDWLTFGVAIGMLLNIHIPQPLAEVRQDSSIRTLTLGLSQVWRQPELRLLLVMTLLFWFFHDMGEAIYDPMILARTNGNAQVLASTASAAGVGGVIGATLVSLWGGSRHRIHSLCSSFIGVGLSKTVFGMGQNLKVWLPAQFCSSLHFPLLSSSETAIWMEKIAPEMQGRIFAANEILLQISSAMAALIAAALVNLFLEPTFMQKGDLAKFLELIFGTGTGGATSLLYILCSLSMLSIGIVGYCLPQLKRIAQLPTIVNRR